MPQRFDSVIVRVALTPEEWESFKRVAVTKRLNAAQLAGVTLRKLLPKGRAK